MTGSPGNDRGKRTELGGKEDGGLPAGRWPKPRFGDLVIIAVQSNGQVRTRNIGAVDKRQEDPDDRSADCECQTADVVQVAGRRLQRASAAADFRRPAVTIRTAGPSR